MKLVLPEVPLDEAVEGQDYLLHHQGDDSGEWVFGILKAGRAGWATQDGPDRPYGWPLRVFESPRLGYISE